LEKAELVESVERLERRVETDGESLGLARRSLAG
jgi:hypothetical protein